MANKDLRKVIIIEDEASIERVLGLIKEILNCDNPPSPDARSLSLLPPESFDSILLDLRCSEAVSSEADSPLLTVRPRLLERVLVITGEVSDPEVLDWVAEICLGRGITGRLAEELSPQVRRLLSLVSAPKPAS